MTFVDLSATAGAPPDCLNIIGPAGSAALQHQLRAALCCVEEFCSPCATEHDCSSCAGERICACDKQAVDHLGELVFLAFERFTAEEKCMDRLRKEMPIRDLVAAHKLAHAEISSRLSTLVHRWDGGNPKSCALELCQHIRTWLHDHVETHDTALHRLFPADTLPSPT